jgi:putative membrane protein
VDEDDEEEESIGRLDPDSRARTYLANERTFLAWFRTGLTLVALGLAAAQFLTRDLITGVPLRRGIAIALVIGGILVTLTGAQRYFQTNRDIAKNEFRPSAISILVTTGLMIVITIVAVVFIFLLR